MLPTVLGWRNDRKNPRNHAVYSGTWKTWKKMCSANVDEQFVLTIRAYYLNLKLTVQRRSIVNIKYFEYAAFPQVGHLRNCITQ